MRAVNADAAQLAAPLETVLRRCVSEIGRNVPSGARAQDGQSCVVRQAGIAADIDARKAHEAGIGRQTGDAQFAGDIAPRVLVRDRAAQAVESRPDFQQCQW